MKVLITGSTGLVGVHALAELLKQGKSVRALVRSQAKLMQCLEPFAVDTRALEIVEGDVTDSAALPDVVRGCDALVHCAGIYSNNLKDEGRLRRINIDGTRNILMEAHKQQLDPMIFISSYLALFPPAGRVMTEREAVKSPREMYARSKAEAERIVRDLQDREKAPIVSIYPGSIQGPLDPTYGIGTQILEQAVKTRKMLVTEGGRGYTDVRDLAQLINKACEPGRGPRRYMFGGYFIEHEDMLGVLEKATGRKIKPIRIPGRVLRFIGGALDIVSRLTGKSFLLSGEAAQVLTRSVPTDDSPVVKELGLELVGYEKSFDDLFHWMRDIGKVRF